MKKCKTIVAKAYDEPAEVKYVITPKGCALLAFRDAEIEVDEEYFNKFWNSFEEHMKKAGYIGE